MHVSAQNIGARASNTNAVCKLHRSTNDKTKGAAMKKNHVWRVTPAVALALALFVFTACSKKSSDESTGGPAAGGATGSAPVDKSQAGGVSGTVKFTGTK